MRCSTSQQGCSSAPRPRLALMPCRARRVRRQRECHLYFAHRVSFLSCADTGGRARLGAGSEHWCERGDFRGSAWLGAGHRGQRDRRSRVVAACRRADARTCRAARGGAASAGCYRPSNQPGQHPNTRYWRPRIDARVRRSRRQTSIGNRPLARKFHRRRR